MLAEQPPNVLFSASCAQDEISTGLDSSTTYLITKCIRNFVHMQDVSPASMSKWTDKQRQHTPALLNSEEWVMCKHE